MKISLLPLGLIFVSVIVSGCVQDQSGTTVAIRTIMLTNQSVNTQAEAEYIFTQYRQDLWNRVSLVYGVAFPIFNATSIKPYDNLLPEDIFLENLGTIKFVMELPYSSTGPNPDWKVENDTVLLRTCKGRILQINDTNTTCTQEGIIWIAAPVWEFWINDMGFIFTKGNYGIFEGGLFDAQWVMPPSGQIDVFVGNETNISVTITPKTDVSNYVLNLSVPPGLQLIEVATWSGNFVAYQPVTLTWKIKGTATGTYNIFLKGKALSTGIQINVREPASGTGIPT